MQFSVYKNKNPKIKIAYPYFVDVQSDLLRDLQTRVVIPVTKLAAHDKKPLKHLTPIVDIGSQRFLLLTPQLAGVASKDLGSPIASVAQFRTEIVAALNFLIAGI